MDIPIVLVLDKALRTALIPIDGVSVGDPRDRATWRVAYAKDATDDQRLAGNLLVATIDPADAVTVAAIRADQVRQVLGQGGLDAVTQALWEAIPAPLLTLAQVRDRLQALQTQRATTATAVSEE